ncbi:DUF2796 domain-containing protein [Thauera sp.]|jgi:hypothetical protein|uniref:DUF2796 domain-containing protein n=1 Tax=Thauera sp. TaxID=1905334 RepID=UPI002A35B304|nr:DUF2796 domain-containing protein [Thauera sp.]MDX9885429.1 DUF2796 domain-containing protein [Thauera sp.]
MHPSTRITFARFASLVALLVAVGLPSVARAQHTHGAHEHGAAELTVALEGRALIVELISPLDNLVGFEHAPASDAQRAALAEAGRRLRDAGAMFALPAAAACKLEHAEIESPWPMAGTAPAPGQGGHAHAGHGHAQSDLGGHEDVVVTYRFSCAQPEALNQLEVRAFVQFPRLRELRVEHATERGQGAAVLVSGAATLAL